MSISRKSEMGQTKKEKTVMFSQPRQPAVVVPRNLITENKRSIVNFKPKPQRTRHVPAFSVQTMQKDAVAKPLTSKKMEQKPPTKTHSIFSQMYDRGDFPLRLDHFSRGWQLLWTHPIDSLDYDVVLPRFFEGLSDTREPYQFIADKGVNDLLDNYNDPVKITRNLPYLIAPLRSALAIEDQKKRRAVLVILGKLARVPMCGPALIPYYRQLLPFLRSVRQKGPTRPVAATAARGVGEPRWTAETLEDVVEKTLHTLETQGGRTAYINIKYVIPAYESCMGSR